MMPIAARKTGFDFRLVSVLGFLVNISIAIPTMTMPNPAFKIRSLPVFSKKVPGRIPASSIRDRGITTFREMFFLSRHAMKVLVGMLNSKSSGVVSLLDTANEKSEPITSVFPNPVMPFTK
jgi:hypothetical protein